MADWSFRPSRVTVALVDDKNQHPTLLYNRMIHPLQPYAVRGVIWYQGESNVGRAEQYEKLFPAMITGWRNAWQQGAFPFLENARFVGTTP